MQAAVKHSYRQLLRAQRFTFAGDVQQLASAAAFTAQQYRVNAHVQGEEEVQALLKIAHQAAIIIRRNIVQGVAVQPDEPTRFSTCALLE
jgi:hypothetical protein